MKRDNFTSRIGAILAAAGSAVGLGNIWRFPCETGENGGAAFILVYICCIVFITVPVLIAELSAGREARRNVYDAFSLFPNQWNAGKYSRLLWRFVGAMCVLAGFLVFSYYSVVAGWTLQYTVEAGIDSFAGKQAEQIANDFSSFISHPVRPAISMTAFIVITMIIVMMGVRKGIEKGSKIMMPLLLVLMVVLAICSVSLPNASEGLKFLFYPDFSKITPTVIIEAMGQAFFTLSVGMGCLMTYATYFSDKVNIVKDSFSVAFIDTCVALLAGVIIFPAAISVGVSPDAGPSLVFITLPNVFQMAFGGTPWLCYVVTVLFYLLLVMAALTSTISMLEITTAFVNEKFGLSRRKAAFLLSLVTCVAGFACSMSFGDWSNVTLFGLGFFDLFDFFVAKLVMPIGGIFMCLLMNRLGKQKVVEMLTNNGTLPLKRFAEIFFFLVSWVIPLMIILIFVSELIK